MKRMATVALAAVFAATAWGAAVAEWEHVGRITDKDGTPLTGEQTLEVRLYGSMTETNVLWGREAKAFLDADGHFSLRLNDALDRVDDSPTNSLASVLASGPVFAEVKGPEGAMTPRAALAATPYAMFAAGAEGAAGAFDVPTNLVVEGTAKVPVIHAESARAEGAVTVAEKMTVKGKLTAGGGFKAPVPLGTIVLYYGTNIPPGWARCDGSTTNGITTPDLRGRFVVGAGSQYSIGSTGGVSQVTLTVDELPSHSHNFEWVKMVGYLSGNTSATVYSSQGITTTTNTVGDSYGTVPSDGYGHPHNNLPPYIALDYIMRVE